MPIIAGRGRPPSLSQETMTRFYATIPWEDVHTVTIYRDKKRGHVRLRFTHPLAYAEACETDAGFADLLRRLSQELLPDFPVFDMATFSHQCQNFTPFETVLWRRPNDERTHQNDR